MHPIQLAAAKLHEASRKLHEAVRDVDITSGEKKDFAEILLGLMPSVIEGAQELWAAATTFLLAR